MIIFEASSGVLKNFLDTNLSNVPKIPGQFRIKLVWTGPATKRSVVSKSAIAVKKVWHKEMNSRIVKCKEVSGYFLKLENKSNILGMTICYEIITEG